MDLTPLIASVHSGLAAAADTGDETVKRAAERLTAALEPTLRLAMMAALSQAAAELTAELPSGQIEVRLKGSDPQMIVAIPPNAAPPVPPIAPTPPEPPEAPDAEPDDGDISRLTLRLPRALKDRAEHTARREGKSLNGWITDSIQEALAPTSSSFRFATREDGAAGNSYTGWA